MDSIKLDSIHCDILIPARVAARLKRRAKERGVSMSHYINVMLFAHTHEDPWTDEDEKERQRIINSNKRRQSKSKKETRKDESQK